MDDISREQRHKCMSTVKSRNTGPELILRRRLWQDGIRGYRLHARLTGSPDLYFPGTRLAVFVDGCFWHGCPVCKTIPRTREEFWSRKIRANGERDRAVDANLTNSGIMVVRMWEHEVLGNPEQCSKRVVLILQERRNMNQGPGHRVDRHCDGESD